MRLPLSFRSFAALLAATALIASAIIFASPVLAQIKEISDNEKAIFAFHKLSGGDPTYEDWIKASLLYQDAGKDMKPEILEQETQRLKWGFGAYEPMGDYLSVKTRVKVRLIKNPAANRLLFRFFNSKMEEEPTFPYSYYGNKWVVMLINNLTEFKAISMTDEEFKNARALLEENGVYPAELRMRMRPIAADAGDPIKESGMEKYLMLADIGHLEFIYKPTENSEEKIIWSYTAPWYQKDTIKEQFNVLEQDDKAPATAPATP